VLLFSYEQEVGSVLKLVEDSQGRRGYPAILLQFLNTLVNLQPPKLAALLPKIAAVSSKVLKSGDSTARAASLSLLLSLAQKTAQPTSPGRAAVHGELEALLPVSIFKLQ